MKINLVSDTIDRTDINALIHWLSQDKIPRLTKGPLTWELEEKWAKKIGTKHSVFVNSGSSAILLMLAALKEFNYLHNNKIVVPALSWATDVSSPMLLGLEPILCDCNLEDLSCDLTHLEEIFKRENPSSLLLVSPLGLVPKMNELVDLCERYGVLLLEDVCESMGSKLNSKYLGTFGLASVFSLYFGHHLSVTHDTPIPYINKMGDFKIDTIKTIYDEYNNSPEQIKVISFNGKNKLEYVSPSHIIKHKNIDDLLNITLDNNRKVCITKAHSVFTLDSNNQVSPISGSELKIDDYIAVPKSIPQPEIINSLNLFEILKDTNDKFFVINYEKDDLDILGKRDKSKSGRQRGNWLNRKVLPIEYVNTVTEDLQIAFKNSPKYKYIPYNLEITPELCRLIGYYIAEGSYTTAGLNFSFHKNEREYIEDVKKIFLNIFNQKCRESTFENCTTVIIDNKTIKYLFKDILRIQSGAINKRIPSIIWASTIENKINYLYGHFCGDGTSDADRISISSVNVNLINDISYLCNMLGVRGSIQQTTKPRELIIKGRKTKSKGNWSFRIYNAILTKDGFIKRNSDKFHSGLAEKVIINEDKLINGDLTFLKIKKIEVVKSDSEYVYDFSVPYVENFIGGLQPICLHNSTIEGGFINTDDTEFYHALLMMRSHGWDRDLPEWKQQELRKQYDINEFDSLYTFYTSGLNVRSTDLQAFLGIRAVDKLDYYSSIRYANFVYYLRFINNNKLDLRIDKNGFYSNFAYPVIHKKRNEIIQELQKNNIEVRPLIAGNIGNKPFWYNKYGKPTNLPNCDLIDKEGFYLPNHQDLTEKEIKIIIEIINSFN